MSQKNYDLLIIGAGPAGYTASIYASRYRVSNAVIGDVFGGLATEAHKICNYPSEDKIAGFELMTKMQQNAQDLGGELIFGRVSKIKKENDNFRVFYNDTSTGSVSELIAKKIILATGSKRRRLNLENEQKFLGKGVSYCATCDGAFVKDKIAMVVGGANSAVTAALHVSEFAKKVYLVYRGEKLKATPMWLEELNNTENIEVIYQAEVKELLGENKLDGVILTNGDEVSVEHLFVEIGADPANELAKSLGVELTEKGYIKVDKAQKTNVDGIWAAGDITDGSNNFRQIVTACGEGAVAAQDAFVSAKG